MPESRIYTVRLPAPYEYIVQKATEKTDFKNLSEVIRWGLDLVKKELELKVNTDSFELEFTSPNKDPEEWQLAGKLTTEQLTEYQKEYEPKGLSIKEYCKFKELDF